MFIFFFLVYHGLFFHGLLVFLGFGLLFLVFFFFFLVMFEDV